MSYVSSLDGVTIIGGPSLKPQSSSSLSNLKSTFFNGEHDYVTIDQPANLEWVPDAKECTISCWFKPDRVDAQQFLIAKAKMESVSVSYIVACNNDGSVYALVGGDDGGGGSIEIGIWYNIILTIRNVADTYTAFLFLNGLQIATWPAGTDQNTDVDWMIGCARWNDNVSDSYPFEGNIDEVTFWNSAFSNTDVTNLYNSGTPNNPNNHSQASNLLHWYRMGDTGDTFPTVTDRKGAANGTCTNMAGAANFETDVP